MSIRVLETTGSTLVQDLGRPGLSAWGVGPSGVFDRTAFRHANLLLGNEVGSAVLEHFGGPLSLMATRDHAMAVTGALGPVWVDERPVSTGEVVRLPAGSLLRIGVPTVGLRYLIGVAGGFDPAPVLGSRSRDTLAELGPEPVVAGAKLSVGLTTAIAWTGSVPRALPSCDFRLRVVLGPRDDWFTPASVARLLTTPWQVDSLAGRVGIRLNGPKLERSRSEELLSEGVTRGSIQVTNNGMPIILGPDHPVTGGYPVIGVVLDSDTDVLAHVRPGDTISLSRFSA